MVMLVYGTPKCFSYLGVSDEGDEKAWPED